MEAKATGVNVNFYPVVDVNNNQRNPIINIRSFGEDPLRVSDMAKAYIRGGQGQGVLATAKHFPGHGDTATDSHLDLPVIEASKDRLNSVELPPFRAAVETGVAAVMTAHVSVPALEKEVGLPATLSRSVMTGLLREEMRFDGLIFTDAMNMGGIVRKYPPGEAALKAFTAGVDIILYPTSVKEACEGLLEGVRLGKISRERLDASVRRILETKARLGLHRRKQVDLLEIDSKVGLQEHQKTAQSIMDAAVTLVRDQGGVLPLGKLTPDDEVLVVTLLDERRPQETRGAAFVQALQQRHKKCTSVEILPGTPEGEVRLVRDLARRCDYVVAGAYVRVSAFKGSIEVSPNQIQLLKSLAALDKPAAFVLFGSPYLLLSAPELPNCIVTYEDYPGAELAAVKAVLGEIPFRGRLPISLPGLYSTGHGVMK
jgi:beta-N-acetylhexosaminidase